MNIKDFRDLAKLLKLCRANGVQSVEIDGVKLILALKPATTKKQAAIDDTAFPEERIPVPQYNGQPLPEEPVIEAINTPDSLTEEQALMWSASSIEEVAEQ